MLLFLVQAISNPRRTRQARRASLPLLTCAHDSIGSSSGGSSSLGMMFLSPKRLSFRKTKNLKRTSTHITSPSGDDENQKEEVSAFSECNDILSAAATSWALTKAVSSSAVVPDLPSLSYNGTPNLPSHHLRSSALLHGDGSDCLLASCAVDYCPLELNTTLQQALLRRAPPLRSSSMSDMTIGSSSSSSPLSSMSASPVDTIKVFPGSYPRSRSVPEEEMRKYHGSCVVQFDLEPTVHFIDIAHDDDRDMLWWNRGDLQARQVLERYMNSEPVATPAARDYYETSSYIYHEVSCGGQIHHDVLVQLLPGLDNGLRGTEINCTDVGIRRKERSREIVRLIVNAQGKRADRHRPESLRFQSCRFTKNSRKIAHILALADRMAVEADFDIATT